MRIYTRTGDRGKTSLVYGKRVSKDDQRVQAFGTCDETNSMIGLALQFLIHEEFQGKAAFLEIFNKVQTSLFHVGAEIATPSGKEVKWKVSESDITELEKQIDEWDAQLRPLQQFILPGGQPAAAALHVARTMARRAERYAVSIKEEVNPLVLQYLNRLSDFLFVSARFVNYELNVSESVLHEEFVDREKVIVGYKEELEKYTTSSNI
jgi:cob(I)alamin adenosyltransferase